MPKKQHPPVDVLDSGKMKWLKAGVLRGLDWSLGTFARSSASSMHLRGLREILAVDWMNKIGQFRTIKDRKEEGNQVNRTVSLGRDGIRIGESLLENVIRNTCIIEKSN
jgi:hypothetical protein